MSLFGIARRDRPTLDGTMYSDDFQHLNYSGERLDQFDEDVWLAILVIGHKIAIKRPIPITLREVAQRVGIGNGGKDLARIRASIDRMKRCKVDYYAGMIDNHRGPLMDSTDRGEIILPRRLISAFLADQRTGQINIDFAHRMMLDSYLAKWLHGLIQSYGAIFPLSVTWLAGACATQCQTLYGFRAEVRRALRELERRGRIRGWEIGVGDLVYVDPASEEPLASRGSLQRGF